jgi:hypothetical protein
VEIMRNYQTNINTIYKLSQLCIIQRQVRLRESSGLLDIWLNLYFGLNSLLSEPSTTNVCRLTTLTCPRDHPCCSPQMDYWLGIAKFFPSLRLVEILKAPRKLCFHLPPSPIMRFCNSPP